MSCRLISDFIIKFVFGFKTNTNLEVSLLSAPTWQLLTQDFFLKFPISEGPPNMCSDWLTLECFHSHCCSFAEVVAHDFLSCSKKTWTVLESYPLAVLHIPRRQQLEGSIIYWELCFMKPTQDNEDHNLEADRETTERIDSFDPARRCSFL